MNNNLAVSVHKVTKRYGRLIALNDVSLDVERGEVYGILGRNGAGKTTLVEIIEGMRKRDSGDVFVLGSDLSKNINNTKERIGIQLQVTSFFPKLRVIEIIAQFRSYYKRQADLNWLLDLVALNEKRNSYVRDLSVGQRHRLALVLALVNDPEIVFLDEPTAGLDAQVRRQLWHTIEQVRASGKTVLLTTHYIEEAERLCDRVCIIDEGRRVALDTPANLVARSKSHPVRICLTTLKPFPIERVESMTLVEADENGKAKYVVQTTNTGRAIVELAQIIEHHNNELLELQIMRASLEDVFIELTQRKAIR